MKTIVIEGIKYKLVPLKGKKASQGASKKVSVPEKSGLDEYTGEEKVKKAVPKVSEYRERFKKGKLRLGDVVTRPTILKELPRQDKELDQFGDLFFGKGIEQTL